MARSQPEQRPAAGALHAIVLAAGQGRRLGGRTKAALRIDGRSLLARLLDALRDGAEPSSLTVLHGDDTGAWSALRAELAIPAAARPGVRLLRADRPLPTLGHSRHWALRQHLDTLVRQAPGDAPGDAPDLLLCVADLPRLQAADVAALCRQWRAETPRPFDALRPQVDGRPGHPVLLSARAVRALAAQPPEVTPAQALASAGLRMATLPMDSLGPVADLDTPDDLQALRTAWPQADIRWPED